MTAAWTVLIAWPAIAAIFYRTMSLPAALCATLLGGYLLLPTPTAMTSLDLPLLPPLDKSTIPALSALVLTLIAVQSRNQRWPIRPGWAPRSRVVLTLLGLLVAGAFGTVLTNGDFFFYGGTRLYALRPYDAFSMVLEIFMDLIPFFLARKVLASPEGQRVLLVALVVSATAYTFPALYEVRMSPQINNMVYGFFPSSWLQTLRSNGYRPVVFLNHGLAVSLYLSLAVIAAFGLLRAARARRRGLWAGLGLWLLFTLALSKSLGALVVCLTCLAVLFLLPRRLQLIVALAIAMIVIIYPVPRAAGLIPTDSILNFFGGVSEERAASLSFRLWNEDLLMARAQERPVFGWGGYGRNRIYTEDGYDISTTDGAWIIQLGTGGWVRYFGIFGLMIFGVVGFVFRRGRELNTLGLTMVLAMTANLVDLIPNAGITPLTWLMAGSLLGLAERRAAGHEAPAAADSATRAAKGAPARAGVTYARSGDGLNAGPADSRTTASQPAAAVYRRPPPAAQAGRHGSPYSRPAPKPSGPRRGKG